MELPSRATQDRLLRPGEMTDIRRRLRRVARRHDLTCVIACAFDHRTRMLPFLYAERWMVPAGVRAIGAAMADAGFRKTRIVLQQWNRGFRPSQMRLDGRIPDLFLISSLQIHSAPCMALIRDACRIDAAHRPLIVVGGPLVIYEPWTVFRADPADPWGANVAVTGEEYVLLGLLEVLLSVRAAGPPAAGLRETFLRARDDGLLDGIPGLLYARGGTDGMAEELVDTGIQRLLGDLDELPRPALGYELLEPPGRKAALSSRALERGRVRRHSPIASLFIMAGCKFACPYCPIPAYNQRRHRMKSGPRIADEMRRLHNAFGFKHFSLIGGNFFNDRHRAADIAGTLARTELNGRPLGRTIRWGTEATVLDTLRASRHLPLMRQAGLQALWLGVEDMTATLIDKGQSVGSTLELFGLLRAQGIFPMPMMMHDDEQPLYTRGSARGLLNQVRLLRKAGAADVQILMTTPAPGSRLYDRAYASGLVFESVGGRRIEPYMLSDSFVVASRHGRPWRKQLNLTAAYVYFHNPLRFLAALVRPKTRPYLADAGLQLLGMWGLAQTIRRTSGWALRLLLGRSRRAARPPVSRIPMRSAAGGPASHALPGTAVARPPGPPPQRAAPVPVSAQLTG